MIFDQSGSLEGVSRHDYLPFGEELHAGQGGRTTAQGYVGDNVRQKFSLYERDNETELDYAQARYYSSTQGRFTSVDPYDVNLERQYEADYREAKNYSTVTQARELLALPSTNSARSLFAIDSQVLSRSSLLRSGFVPASREYNRLGGGFLIRVQPTLLVPRGGSNLAF